MVLKAGRDGRGISRQSLASPGAAHSDGKYTNTTPSPSEDGTGAPRCVTNTAATTSATPNPRQERFVTMDLMLIAPLRRSAIGEWRAPGYQWHKPAAQQRQRFVDRAEPTQFTVLIPAELIHM